MPRVEIDQGGTRVSPSDRLDIPSHDYNTDLSRISHVTA